ncbi:hypothetical protein B0A49_10225 [Cryomyces minteri]|uniref:Uncharacterized protein n=1 Tax=Cryomyces minteri TaxID=331657 RepID=A0A4U0WGG3_9PEZI|nr:hypothetical protein B0A49_10225 [Cryomyces minteri]
MSEISLLCSQKNKSTSTAAGKLSFHSIKKTLDDERTRLEFWGFDIDIDSISRLDHDKPEAIEIAVVKTVESDDESEYSSDDGSEMYDEELEDPISCQITENLESIRRQLKTLSRLTRPLKWITPGPYSIAVAARVNEIISLFGTAGARKRHGVPEHFSGMMALKLAREALKPTDDVDASLEKLTFRTPEASWPQHVPMGTKVHRDYVSVETLTWYDLPYVVDKADPSKFVVLQELDEHEIDMLYEHSRRSTTRRKAPMLPLSNANAEYLPSDIKRRKADTDRPLFLNEHLICFKLSLEIVHPNGFK